MGCPYWHPFSNLDCGSELLSFATKEGQGDTLLVGFLAFRTDTQFTLDLVLQGCWLHLTDEQLRLVGSDVVTADFATIHQWDRVGCWLTTVAV